MLVETTAWWRQEKKKWKTGVKQRDNDNISEKWCSTKRTHVMQVQFEQNVWRERTKSNDVCWGGEKWEIEVHGKTARRAIISDMRGRKTEGKTITGKARNLTKRSLFFPNFPHFTFFVSLPDTPRTTSLLFSSLYAHITNMSTAVQHRCFTYQWCDKQSKLGFTLTCTLQVDGRSCDFNKMVFSSRK